MKAVDDFDVQVVSQLGGPGGGKALPTTTHLVGVGSSINEGRGNGVGTCHDKSRCQVHGGEGRCFRELVPKQYTHGSTHNCFVSNLRMTMRGIGNVDEWDPVEKIISHYSGPLVVSYLMCWNSTYKGPQFR